VYIDTLLVCTATAVMILSTGMYNVIDESTGTMIVQNAPHLTETSVSYTQAAVSTIMPNTGNAFIAFSLLFFAFTTLMAYYYYAETGLVYLFGKISKPGIWFLRICLLVSTLYGSFNESTLAWKFGDLGVGMMAWINMFAILLLFPKAIRTLYSYERQKKEGKEPVFSPKELNIKNADYWIEGNKD
jgi:AGCS family alanine or glycine:cation symporter